MKNSEFYVTGMALSQFVHGAKALGLDVHGAMAQAQLTDNHLNPTAHVPEPQYDSLIMNLVAEHKNDSFGAEIGQQLMLPLYGPLLSLAFHSPTLNEAIKNFTRYLSLSTGNCGGVEYRMVDNVVELSAAMIHRNPVVRRHVSECVLVLLLGIIRLIAARPEFMFNQVWVQHAPSSEAARKRLASILGCSIRWDKQENKIFIPEELHSLRILGHGNELLRAAEEQAQQQLDKIDGQTTWIARVKWHVRDLIVTSAPRREIIANRLEISTRTLDRYLEKSGISWQQLLDSVRLQLAIDLLADERLTVAEIATKLGFTEVRAFQRRFKTWTDMTPSAYRKKNQN